SFHNNSTTQQEPASSIFKGQEKSNTLTPMEKEAGWVLLFNGEILDSWRGVYEKKVPKSWIVKNGLLTIQDSNNKQRGRGGKQGSIVTKKEYTNFIFKCDFKLSEGANTGIKYFVVENPDFFKGDPNGRGIGL